MESGNLYVFNVTVKDEGDLNGIVRATDESYARSIIEEMWEENLESINGVYELEFELGGIFLFDSIEEEDI